jgi:hypothetical protein
MVVQFRHLPNDVREPQKWTNYFAFSPQHFNRFSVGHGVGGDFGMVLAEVAAAIHQREHLTSFIR